MDVSDPQPSTSYAAVAALSQAARHTPPPAPTPIISSAASAAAAAVAVTATGATVTAPRKYPPLVVECLPNWMRHFENLRRVLGHAPSARPLGRGVRFLPQTEEEFRAVQRYLTEEAERDKAISFYCYSIDSERPTKVAIRGLPYETPVEEVVAALQRLGFPAESARALPPAKGKHGCLYFVQLAHMSQELLAALYATTEILCMPGVTVEAWRGGSRPPQCHRCQLVGHASTNCHRPTRCIRCAGEHLVRNCPRPRTDAPTCANCGQGHAANDHRCPYLRREARKRGINVQPPRPRAPPAPTGGAEPRTARLTTAAIGAASTPTPGVSQAQGAPQTQRAVALQTVDAPTTLAPPANPPTERGRATRSGRRKNRKAARLPRSEPTAASTPHSRGPSHVPDGEQFQPQTDMPTCVIARMTAPVQISDQAPAQTIALAPAQTPAQASAQSPILTPTQTPAPAPALIPIQAPAQAPAQASAQIPVRAPAHTSTQVPQVALTKPPRPLAPPARLPECAAIRVPAQAFFSEDARVPARTAARQHTPTTAQPTNVAPPHNIQGEGQSSPDAMALVRVVLEAVMASLAAYLQGQGLMPAIAAGMAVLTRALTH